MENPLPAYEEGSRFIRILMKMGSSSPLEPEEKRKRISAVFILLVGIFASSSFSIYHLFSRHYSVFLVNWAAFFIFLATIFYVRKKKKAIFVYWIMGGVFTLFCSATTIFGRTEISYLFWGFVLSPIAFSILGDKKGLVVSLVFFCLNLVLMAAPETMVSSPPYSQNVIIRFSIIYIILTLIIYYYETSQQMLINYIQQEKDKFENDSKYDPLTGLSNRRDMMTKIEEERDRQIRQGNPFTLIIGDIDNFKNLNDTFGHDNGDYVLKMIALLLKNQVRSIDCACRWGGEEFLIMLVDTDLEGGHTMAERIRRTIETTVFNYKQESFPVTMTFGMSVYQGADDNIEACIKRADQALYDGKSQGKNRVVTA